ncbi:MAG: flavodoxin reductase [Chitinophagaceae bacterium]|nr:flavodoxin reductase [Chitinophagaceae bacterium]
MEHTVTIKSIRPITHDVFRIQLEKPEGITYIPGQACDITLTRPGWEKEVRTFTFTSLQDDDHVEFSIKTYPSHNGVTNQIRTLKAGDKITLHDIYGDIHYKGEGVFIAGGAGVTPFIAIFKLLKKNGQIGNNKLIFANKTKGDIIDKDRFEKLLGKNFINVLSDEQDSHYEHGYVTPDLIKKYSDSSSKYYYLCGPGPMMDAVEKHLHSLGVKDESIVKEGF